MSNLIAISYPDVATAVAVRDRLSDLQRENLITMEDVAVVERRSDGTITLHQSSGTTGMEADGGAMTDAGVNDAFMSELAGTLEPGTAALFVLVVRSISDKVVPEIQSYGGHVIQTSLSREEEAQLRELLEGAGAR
ncbi:DUF1269 domain-containing protein [Nonomuraea spiralis]|uniref:DUF1269 domain-containing protein n=1 Tax=Nonomuraea TaxID=83681 RepID=UPI000F7B7E87|nr:DUF1269 domain-containing protein [Nonomuraea sp. WAC 01424]RSN03095.1 hypothetical protein DMB42_35270 [Nonomuraea sp. WAC 01424]